ncbi:MAG: hypothetical protein P4L59_19645 [Desulfosporosinus sp.]|nr:hypothetical protein [Desulfosporosinus sp.]
MSNYPDQLDVLYFDRSAKLSNGDYPVEYRESLEKFTALCEEIKAALPEGKGHLLTFELDSVLGAFASIHQQTGYRLGFKDAFRLSAALMETA